VTFNVTDQLLTRYFPFIRYWKKWEYNETVHQLHTDFKKAFDSVRREVLYSILIESGVPTKLIRLIKMCLNEMYSEDHIGKHFSHKFPIQNGLKQGDSISPLLFNFALEYAIMKVQEVGLEVNAEKNTYMLLSHHQNAGQNHNIKIANKAFENVTQFKYLGMTVTNQNLTREEITRRLNSDNACYYSVKNLLLKLSSM
jgi:hypothetical protein